MKNYPSPSEWEKEGKKIRKITYNGERKNYSAKQDSFSKSQSREGLVEKLLLSKFFFD